MMSRTVANSWPYLDIKVFSRKYSYVYTRSQITAASDWPRLFLHPRCFCLAFSWPEILADKVPLEDLTINVQVYSYYMYLHWYIFHLSTLHIPNGILPTNKIAITNCCTINSYIITYITS